MLLAPMQKGSMVFSFVRASIPATLLRKFKLIHQTTFIAVIKSRHNWRNSVSPICLSTQLHFYLLKKQNTVSLFHESQFPRLP